ncbi:MAG: hypothetical protein GF315_13810 [candidate division Zixibacteria bacterium]|nr:hypothetical protein [candidate division Zixibacteria bacterium]
MKNSHAISLGLSFIIASIIFGAFHYNSRSTDDTIQVVGAATRRFDADIVKWRVTISRTAGIDNINQGYRMIYRYIHRRALQSHNYSFPGNNHRFLFRMHLLVRIA